MILKSLQDMKKTSHKPMHTSRGTMERLKNEQERCNKQHKKNINTSKQTSQTRAWNHKITKLQRNCHGGATEFGVATGWPRRGVLAEETPPKHTRAKNVVLLLSKSPLFKQNYIFASACVRSKWRICSTNRMMSRVTCPWLFLPTFPEPVHLNILSSNSIQTFSTRPSRARRAFPDETSPQFYANPSRPLFPPTRGNFAHYSMHSSSSSMPLPIH